MTKNGKQAHSRLNTTTPPGKGRWCYRWVVERPTTSLPKYGVPMFSMWLVACDMTATLCHNFMGDRHLPFKTAKICGID